MFRRRRPIRPIRPLRGGLRPGPRSGHHAPPELIRANQMMEAGNYRGAAEQFETIARVVESRGGPRAPVFFLQAGRAYILAGENDAGMTHITHGLTILANRADWPHLHGAGNRTIAELKKHGLTAESDQISKFLKANLPENFTAPGIATSSKKTVLPTHCPSCGGALRPDEVEWLDDVTAECAYCGSPVREEK